MDTRKIRIPAALITLIALGVSVASAAQRPRTGEDTRQWLEQQRASNARPAVPRPMPGDIAEKVYERYLKSFSHPLPEYYDRQRFVDQD